MSKPLIVKCPICQASLENEVMGVELHAGWHERLNNLILKTLNRVDKLEKHVVWGEDDNG